MVKQKILVADDEATIRDIVRQYLTVEGYEVVEASHGPQALQVIYEQKPDLVILDIMLPGLDGLTILQSLRKPVSSSDDSVDTQIPIIMLTARLQEEDRIAGFEYGADDYVVKPFSPRELVMRVKAVLRRGVIHEKPTSPEEETIVFGDIRVEPFSRSVFKGDAAVTLTAKEFDLLLFLVQNPRRVFSRNQLLNQVWGYEFYADDTITVHIHRLREKLEATPNEPQYIHTVWGVGYKFEML